MWEMIRFYGRKFRKTVKGWEQERQLLRRFPSARFELDVQIKSPCLLTLGKNVLIQKGTVVHCGGMDWSNGRGKITIGDDAVISPHCILYGAGEIEIGDRFDCGPGNHIYSSRTNYGVGEEHIFEKVVIGDDVILFAGCIISPGVTIGDRAVVGAGSLVLQDLPADGVYAGTPAKKTGDRPN